MVALAEYFRSHEYIKINSYWHWYNAVHSSGFVSTFANYSLDLKALYVSHSHDICRK